MVDVEAPWRREKLDFIIALVRDYNKTLGENLYKEVQDLRSALYYAKRK